ncbi:hypothetical protein LTR66_007793 [Elasticomyces elasticus]|nr:hypothetical protein LTR66_007793 [Elasticomyces elasticus]KAK5010116.1 hypothetical protein LTR28_011712 [Elasticomyces elasticus]
MIINGLAILAIFAALRTGDAKADPAATEMVNAVSEVVSLVDQYLATALPAYISQEFPPVISGLVKAVSSYAPTARVSDVPMLVSIAVPLIDSWETKIESQLIPLVAKFGTPSDIVTEIPAAVSGFVSNLIRVADNVISGQLPPTAPLTALPSALSSGLPALATELLGVASQLLEELKPALSSYAPLVQSYLPELESLVGAVGTVSTPIDTPYPTNGTGYTSYPTAATGSTSSKTAPRTASGSLFTSSVVPFTGDASLRGVTSGLVGAAALVLGVAML